MSDCIVCQAISSEKLLKLYEDNDVVVMLHPKPAVLGHLIVAPKQHYSILETVPSSVLGKAAVVANKFSIFLFEALDAKGTNVIIANGLPAGQTLAHFAINVIPRNENDGLDFQWAPKQISESELSELQASISAEIAALSVAEKIPQKAEPKPAERKAELEEKPKEEVLEEKKESKFGHMIRQLIRIP